MWGEVYILEATNKNSKFKKLTITIISDLNSNCQLPKPGDRSDFTTPTKPVDNVITTKGLQDRNINILDGTTVENKGKLILIRHRTYIFYL